MTALEENIQLFRIFYMWPKKGVPHTDATYKTKFFCAICIPLSLYIGVITKLIRQIAGYERYLIVDLFEEVSLLITAVTFYFVILIFYQEQRRIAEIMRKLNDFAEFVQPLTFHAETKRMCAYLYVYLSAVLIGSLIYCAFPLIDREKCENEARQFQIKKNCGLFLQMSLPFDIDYYRYATECLYVIQSTVGTLFILAGCNILGLIFCISQHIIVRIDMLTELFGDCFAPNAEREERTRRLIYCIKYHNFINTLADDMNMCFSRFLFVVVSVFSFQMGSIAFQFVLKKSFKCVLHFSAWCSTLFIISLFGQRLSNQSLIITDRVYETLWYNEQVALQKHLIPIILRSRKALTLNAGMLNGISFGTFTMLMRTTYTLITFLNMALVEEEEEN